MSRALRLCVLLLLPALPLLAQSDIDPEPPSDFPKADVRGMVTLVTELKASKITLGRITVTGKKEKDTEVATASVTVPVAAKIYRWKSGKKVEAKFSDIQKGDRVQVVFLDANPKLKSKIVRASEVLILAAAKK